MTKRKIRYQKVHKEMIIKRHCRALELDRPGPTQRTPLLLLLLMVGGFSVDALGQRSLMSTGTEYGRQGNSNYALQVDGPEAGG